MIKFLKHAEAEMKGSAQRIDYSKGENGGTRTDFYLE